MTADPEIPSGFLTIPEAEIKYNRSKRQLKRDIRDALISRNESVLGNWQLLLNDGTTLIATECDHNTAHEKKMVDKVNPKWIVNEDWLGTTFGKRGEPRPNQSPIASENDAGNESGDKQEASSSKDRENAADDPLAGLPTDADARIAVLETTVKLIHKQNQDLIAERTRKREDQKATNELVRALSDKIKTSGTEIHITDGDLQSTKNAMLGLPDKSNAPNAPKADVVDAEVVNATTSEPATPKSAPSNSTEKNSAKKKSTKRSTRKAPKPSKPKKKKPAPKSNSQQSAKTKTTKPPQKKGFLSKLFG